DRPRGQREVRPALGPAPRAAGALRCRGGGGGRRGTAPPRHRAGGAVPTHGGGRARCGRPGDAGLPADTAGLRPRHVPAARALRPRDAVGGGGAVEPGASRGGVHLLRGPDADGPGPPHAFPGRGVPAPALLRVLGDPPRGGVGRGVPHLGAGRPADLAPLRLLGRRDRDVRGGRLCLQRRGRHQLRLPQPQAARGVGARLSGAVAVVRRGRGRPDRAGLGGRAHAALVRRRQSRADDVVTTAAGEPHGAIPTYL
ncbi:MAG: hypothetical protein AVDCRST_MAG24-1832, partial [uncultured Nocardioidaceae bacterium]